VTASLVEKAPAKINLTLRVLGRRADGYHDLESLVAFADLTDTLTLEPGNTTTLEISGPFAAASGPVAGNLVLKAVTELRQLKGGLKAGRFRLEKHIPVAAGLGGGSADAAAALRLLARANGLALDDPRLSLTALHIGADVPVCLDPRPRIMRGVGDLLSEPLELPSLPAILVNPCVPLSTRDVFAKFAGTPPNTKFLGAVPRKSSAMINFLKEYDNDLSPAAIRCAPVVGDVMIALGALSAVRLCRMSGSGPTCFAVFPSPGEAEAAARRLQAERKEWWVCATIIGYTEKHP